MSNYTVKINGSLVNVESGTLDVTNQIGQRSTGSITVWSALGVHWGYGTTMAVYDQNGALVFAGFTSKDKATHSSYQGYGHLEHAITLMDNVYLADKRVTFGIYNNQSAGSIVKALVNNVLAAEGVTYTASSIAAGTIITEVVWTGKQVSLAMNWLAQISGYWWNIDVNKVLWFQPYTGLAAPFVLDGTQVNTDSNLSVTYGNDVFCNRQYVTGAFAETASRTESFAGNGTLSYTLSYPVSSISQITVDSVKVPIATKGNSGAYFYYNAGDPVISQDTSIGTLTSGDTVAITYKGRYPILAVAQSASQISAQATREGGGTSGLVENTYHNAKITNQGAAAQDASGLLAHYAADMTQLEFDTLTAGLKEGQLLSVNLPDFNLSNSQMLISAVEITDGINDQFNIWYHVTAVGSPVESAQWQTYWQSLQNQSADPTDLSSIDTQDGTGFSFIFATSITAPAVSATVSVTKYTCLICGPSTLCGPAQKVC